MCRSFTQITEPNHRHEVRVNTDFTFSNTNNPTQAFCHRSTQSLSSVTLPMYRQNQSNRCLHTERSNSGIHPPTFLANKLPMWPSGPASTSSAGDLGIDPAFPVWTDMPQSYQYILTLSGLTRPSHSSILTLSGLTRPSHSSILTLSGLTRPSHISILTLSGLTRHDLSAL